MLAIGVSLELRCSLCSLVVKSWGMHGSVENALTSPLHRRHASPAFIKVHLVQFYRMSMVSSLSELTYGAPPYAPCTVRCLNDHELLDYSHSSTQKGDGRRLNTSHNPGLGLTSSATGAAAADLGKSSQIRTVLKILARSRLVHQFERVYAELRVDAFVDFSHRTAIPDLGMLDPAALTVEVHVAGSDVTLRQSPGLLKSNRAQGTTGADWLAKKDNLLFRCGVLHAASTCVELGCGVSGLLALALGPRVSRYLLTDQDYVLKTLGQNLEDNKPRPAGEQRNKPNHRLGANRLDNISTLSLDWEHDDPTRLPQLLGGDIDVVLACDCIYNEALCKPFVDMCRRICRLKAFDSTEVPTCCLIAQQLRSHEVYETWLHEMLESFILWRVADDQLPASLRIETGHVVHIAVLKEYF
ncbi:hypothetical protein MRB53_039731 [Persea americana]|nr:hypothetical protein MRB53_039731 [Persea americana]